MSSSKISIALAAAALLVSVLVATPLGQAASRLVLPKNSVGTAQLKRNAVGSKKIAKNAITSVKVKNGTLIAADFKAGQLPAGPQGPKGEKGDSGFRDVVARQGQWTTVAPGASALATASCQPDERALGGGPVAPPKFFTEKSHPGGYVNAPDSWVVRVYNSTASSEQVSASVVCAKVG